MLSKLGKHFKKFSSLLWRPVTHEAFTKCGANAFRGTWTKGYCVSCEGSFHKIILQKWRGMRYVYPRFLQPFWRLLYQCFHFSLVRFPENFLVLDNFPCQDKLFAWYFLESGVRFVFSHLENVIWHPKVPLCQHAYVILARCPRTAATTHNYLNSLITYE